MHAPSRFGLFVVVILIGLSACSRQAPQQSADERFRGIYSAEWKWREEQFAADEDSQKHIMDHLPKVDPASQEARLKHWE